MSPVTSRMINLNTLTSRMNNLITLSKPAFDFRTVELFHKFRAKYQARVSLRVIVIARDKFSVASFQVNERWAIIK